MKNLLTALLIFFTSLSYSADFNTLLEKAFLNNKEIASAVKEAESSEYKIKSVKSLYYPEIEGGYFKVIYDKEPMVLFPAGTLAPIPISFPITDDNFTNLNLTLNWLIFDFGGRKSAYKTAKKGFQAAVLKTNMKKREIALELIDRYLNAIILKNYKDVLSQTLETIDKHLENIKEFRKEGLVPKSDVLRIEALKLNIESEKADIDGKLKTVLKDIERICFQKVNAEELKPLPEVKLEENPEKLALENREEIQLLKIQSDVYRLKAKIEKASFLPKLVAKVEYTDSTNALDPVKSNTTYYVGLKFKLFDGMKSRYERKSFLKLSDKSKNLVEDTQNKIKIQIENEIEKLNALKKQYQFYKKAYLASKENFRVVDLQFKEHIVSSVDLKDAIKDLKQAKANLLITEEKVKAEKLKILWLCKKIEGGTHEE